MAWIKDDLDTYNVDSYDSDVWLAAHYFTNMNYESVRKTDDGYEYKEEDFTCIPEVVDLNKNGVSSSDFLFGQPECVEDEGQTLYSNQETGDLCSQSNYSAYEKADGKNYSLSNFNMQRSSGRKPFFENSLINEGLITSIFPNIYITGYTSANTAYGDIIYFRLNTEIDNLDSKCAIVLFDGNEIAKCIIADDNMRLITYVDDISNGIYSRLNDNSFLRSGGIALCIGYKTYFRPFDPLVNYIVSEKELLQVKSGGSISDASYDSVKNSIFEAFTGRIYGGIANLGKFGKINDEYKQVCTFNSNDYDNIFCGDEGFFCIDISGRSDYSQDFSYTIYEGCSSTYSLNEDFPLNSVSNKYYYSFSDGFELSGNPSEGYTFEAKNDNADCTYYIDRNSSFAKTILGVDKLTYDSVLYEHRGSDGTYTAYTYRICPNSGNVSSKMLGGKLVLGSYIGGRPGGGEKWCQFYYYDRSETKQHIEMDGEAPNVYSDSKIRIVMDKALSLPQRETPSALSYSDFSDAFDTLIDSERKISFDGTRHSFELGAKYNEDQNITEDLVVGIIEIPDEKFTGEGKKTKTRIIKIYSGKDFFVNGQ